MANLLFYLVALGAVLSGLGVILAKNPVMSVMSLLSTFFCVAVIYLLAGFQFLAAVQILVYAGAIMVLFLFVVMLLNLGDIAEHQGEGQVSSDLRTGTRASLALAVAGGVLLVSLAAILSADLAPTDLTVPEGGHDPVLPLAAQMFSRYSLPLEAASVLLLATAVGIMVLAKRQRPGAAPKEGGGLRIGLADAAAESTEEGA